MIPSVRALVALAWISLGAWLLVTRGLHPGPTLPPGIAAH
jgi:hypothetical protein